MGNEIFKNTTKKDTCAKAELIGDLLSFDLKIAEDARDCNNVFIKMWWQQNSELFYNFNGDSERRYIFSRSSYFKYGSDKDRSNSSYSENQYGTCKFNFNIDFSDMKDWN